jgi:hypothetical protein
MIDSVPNWIEAPIGASIFEVRAEILSSPCRTAIGSGIIAAKAASGAASPSAASARNHLISDKAPIFDTG